MKISKKTTVAFTILFLLSLAAAGAALWLLRPGHGHGGAAQEEAGQLWTCGMHPQVISSEPGTCPICGMDLVPLERPAANEEEQPEKQQQLWTCGMHPQVISSEPGTCPICGMDLVPLERPAGGEPAGDMPGMDMDGKKDDERAVAIPAGVRQSMNIQVEPVERRDLVRTIRTVGHLEWDERAVTTVTTRYSGFVEQAEIRHEGQPIRRGEVLAEVYSPELVRTAEELLSALRYRDRLAGAAAEERARAEELVAAARRRLELLDVPPDAVRALVERGEVPRTLPVVAPRGGILMDPMRGLAGMEVRPGMVIARLADLRRLVLVAEVYEDQAPWLARGMPAEVTFPFFPGRTFRGNVRDLRPRVAERTRTLELVLPLANPGGELRPGMYAEVRIAAPVARDVVAIPGQAVLRTGVRDVAVVALGDGRFVPRELRLGRSAGGLVEVLEGLSPGEEIVVSSQFLIDSEANLQDAVRKLLGGHGGGHAR